MGYASGYHGHKTALLFLESLQDHAARAVRQLSARAPIRRRDAHGSRFSLYPKAKRAHSTCMRSR